MGEPWKGVRYGVGVRQQFPWGRAAVPVCLEGRVALRRSVGQMWRGEMGGVGWTGWALRREARPGQTAARLSCNVQDRERFGQPGKCVALEFGGVGVKSPTHEL